MRQKKLIKTFFINLEISYIKVNFPLIFNVNINKGYNYKNIVSI